MRPYLTLSLLAACLLILATVHVPVGNTQSRTPHPPQGRNVAKFISSPLMPVDLSSIVAVTDDGQTTLKYAATDRTGGTLNSFDVIALVVDKTDALRGGEVWRVSDALKAAQRVGLTHLMKTEMRDGDHLVLSVWRVSSESGTQELDKTQLDNVFKSHVDFVSQAGIMRLRKIEHCNVALTDSPPYCIGWYEYAASKCACGVKSFSCTESSGAVSWTCYTKAEAPDACKEESATE